jgi:phosphate-selective porin OprO and OprP
VGQGRVMIMGASRRREIFIVAVLMILLASVLSAAQETDADTSQSGPQSTPDKQQKAAPTPSDPTIENTISAVESDESEEATRSFKRWNEFDGKYMTARAGGGFLVDYGAFSQDSESKEQFSLAPSFKLRDFRFLLSGRFPQLKRPVTYSLGVMYDAPTHSWFVRQTGVMIGLSQKWGYLFIGRSKEGFSLNKVMTGYDGWTMERATMNDATVPLLADGFKWMGYLPKHGFMWNLGYYNDIFSKGQSFSSYSSQEVARLAWLPIRAVSETHSLLHLGINFQYGKPFNNQFQFRSRPEAFTAPYFVDTGKFPATAAFMTGPEIYYRRKSWLFGSEYWIDKVSSPSTRNPLFNGGDVVATWIITGETRTYNTVGGYFRAVLPRRPVFDGGPGAWELVSRYSYINLDSGTLQGGRFGRFTEQLNWYLSQYVRLEFAYGYGHLDRFGFNGNTQFFQSRIQLQL